MATKPTAARGKTTRKGKIKKILKNVIARQSKIKDPGMGMSPGAMGGRTKAKFTPRTGTMTAPLKRISENMRRQKLKGMVPMTGPMGKAAKSTIKGAGASGKVMANQAMKLARQLKKTGRLSVDDLMRAKKMMMGRKGK